jgi:hypothetical protein
MLVRPSASIVISPPAAQLRKWKGRVVTAVAFRRSRKRLREALEAEQYKIETHCNRLAQALILSEWLTEAETLDKSKVEAKLKEIAEVWVARWIGRN